MAKTVLDGSAGMSPRKAMASGMGEGAGTFDVRDIGAVTGNKPHPDQTAKTGTKMMGDGARGIGTQVSRGKNMHPAQAAPDHGSTHPGGHGFHKGYSKAL